MPINIDAVPANEIKVKIADMLTTEFLDDVDFMTAYPYTSILIGVTPKLPDDTPLLHIVLVREGNIRQLTGHNLRQYLGHINIYFHGVDEIEFTAGVAFSQSDKVLAYIHDRIIELFDSPPNDQLQNFQFSDGRGSVTRITFKDIQEIGLSERESNLWNAARIPFSVETSEVRTAP